MIKGVEKLQRPIEQYSTLFEYNKKFYTAKEIVKLTKDTWKADYRTKNKIMADWKRWNELSNYEISPHIYVELFNRYYVLENGKVLNKSTMTEIEGDADIRLTLDEGRRTFYRASLVYYAFVDNNFKLGYAGDKDADECWVLDGDYSNATLANVEAKDR